MPKPSQAIRRVIRFQIITKRLAQAVVFDVPTERRIRRIRIRH